MATNSSAASAKALQRRLDERGDIPPPKNPYTAFCSILDHSTANRSNVKGVARPRQLTTTSYAILGLLSLRSWSAYELAQQMKRSLRFCWPRAERGVYDEPKTLVAHGLATASIQQTGARRRTVYEITPPGRRALRRWLAQPSSPPQLESEALLRAQFLEKGSHEDALATLRSLRDYATTVQDQIMAQAQEYLSSGGPFPERLHVIAVTGKFLLDYARLLENWASWAEEQVERWPRFGPLRRDEALQLFEATLREELAVVDEGPQDLDQLTP